MIDFLKGTVGKDYFSDRLYGCQECIAEYLASKEPLSQPTNQSFTNRFIESRIIWIGSTAGFSTLRSWTSGNKIINFCSSHARWIIQTPFFWSTKINLVILFPSFDNLAFNQWWRGWPSSRDVGSLYARLRNYWASHWTLCLNS